MPFQETMTGVAADSLPAVVALYEAQGATSVETHAEPGGTFTVIATFADVPWSTPFATANAAETVAPVVEDAERQLPAINQSTKFSDLAGEYSRYFDACQVRPAHKAEVAEEVERLLQHRARYSALGEALNIPWFFIGIIHSLESDYNFGAHLHNGDPLSARTRRVPKGRPVAGEPPFTWEQSAEDALELKRLIGLTDWSIPRMLFRWESYNGMGYRTRGLASPYLWSFSQHYEKGRFVRDHEFDPESVSKQCGAAVLLKALQQTV